MRESALTIRAEGHRTVGNDLRDGIYRRADMPLARGAWTMPWPPR